MTVKFIYCENVSLRSKVIARVFGYFVGGSVSLFNLSDRVVLYSAESGVKSVILCKNIVE